MYQATFNFFEELNELLSSVESGKDIQVFYKGRQSVKHLIESLRIPHTEVGHIVANELPVDFSYIVQDGDCIKVYPARYNSTGSLNRDAGGQNNDDVQKFLLDNHLGKLATYLRILGFDAAYYNELADNELARIANCERRILVSRDRGLLMRKVVTQGYCVRSLDPKSQLIEVSWRYGLFDKIEPFKRCLRCNGVLEPVDKDAIIHRLQPLTKKYYNEFHFCSMCDKIYWKGSHFNHMLDFLIKVKRQGSK